MHNYYDRVGDVITREFTAEEVEEVEIDPTTVCSAFGSIYEGYHGKRGEQRSSSSSSSSISRGGVGG